MYIDLTEIVTGVLALVFSFIAAWAAKTVLPRLRAWLEARTDAEQRAMLRQLVKQLVLAAEQMFGRGRGAEKLDYVRQQMEKRGFTVDLNAIEAAVREMNEKIL